MIQLPLIDRSLIAIIRDECDLVATDKYNVLNFLKLKIDALDQGGFDQITPHVYSNRRYFLVLEGGIQYLYKTKEI